MYISEMYISSYEFFYVLVSVYDSEQTKGILTTNLFLMQIS